MSAKKTFLLVLLLSILALLVLALFYYHRYVATEKTPSSSEIERQLIERLTAPVGKELPAPKEITKKLTAPQKGKTVPTDILDKLTAPTK